MARITIDDCLKIIPNRFHLTLCAVVRARQLAHGAAPMLEANRDKPAVIALREMAAGKYGAEILAKMTDAAGVVPNGGTASENAWRLITDAAVDSARDKEVVAEPA